MSKQEQPTILVVEDNDPMRMVIKEMLTRQRYQVIEASDGVSALVMAKEHLPHLAIVDLHLPGMSGFELAEQFQGWMPFLVVTVDREDQNVQACLDKGAVGYTLKPPEPDAFVLQVRAALARGRENLNLRRGIRETQSIAKAMGVLMAYFGLTEEEARATLFSHASSQRQRVADLADAIITACNCVSQYRQTVGKGVKMTPAVVAAYECLNQFKVAWL